MAAGEKGGEGRGLAKVCGYLSVPPTQSETSPEPRGGLKSGHAGPSPHARTSRSLQLCPEDKPIPKGLAL